jgi:hypothetical protein
VSAYRFMSWVDGDDPDALEVEYQFFLRGKVDLSDDEEELDEFSSQACDITSTYHFKFAPLPIYGHATDCKYAVPEYSHRYQSARLNDINVNASLHDAQEELMHNIKYTTILLVFLMMFKNGPKYVLAWATSLSLINPKQ